MRPIHLQAAVREAEGGFVVTAGDRPLHTPAKLPFRVPTRALAEAVAAEWRAQEDKIRPETMPLTRQVATALDRVPSRRDEVVAEIAAYADSDLLCYRAETPPELASCQAVAWQPMLDWAVGRYGTELTVVTGVMHRPQSVDVLAVYKEAVAAFEDIPLVALHGATAACGSLVLALALAERHIDATAAFEASQVDESWQIEKWGEDGEAAARRDRLRADIETAARLFELVEARSS